MKFPTHSLARKTLFLVILVTLWAGAAGAEEFERTFTFDSKEMKVATMIGEVKIVQGIGDDFKITTRVRGRDATEDLMEFAIDEGSKGELAVIFPIEDHRKYVYPPLGPDRKSTIHFRNENQRGGSWLKRIFGGMSGKKITVSGDGNGLEVWADLIVEVPAGRRLEVKHGVGYIEAVDLRADLNLDTSSGAISSENLEGDYSADTGSGSVKANRINGSVHVDTGSGDVILANLEGPKVVVDTGSGSVDIDGAVCSELNVDTGSGSVTARTVSADRAVIDTGSGSAHMQLVRMGTGKFVIDTGSGEITLSLPDDASARISADTGSGSIQNQVAGAMVQNQSRDELEMTVGEGEARVILDAGSGGITIR